MSEGQVKSSFEALTPLIVGQLTTVLFEMALDLEIFIKLKGKEVSLEEAGESWGLPAPSVRVLAQYLCGLGLLLYKDGKLSNWSLGRNPVYL